MSVILKLWNWSSVLYGGTVEVTEYKHNVGFKKDDAPKTAALDEAFGTEDVEITDPFCDCSSIPLEDGTVMEAGCGLADPVTLPGLLASSPGDIVEDVSIEGTADCDVASSAEDWDV